MSHTDPEILALRALGETAGTDRDDEHAATCADCRAEQARLTDLVALARTGDTLDPTKVRTPGLFTETILRDLTSEADALTEMRTGSAIFDTRVSPAGNAVKIDLIQ